jgi:DNA-binding NarL/FixJ family response regulator
MRIVIGEDSVLVRAGAARLLEDGGMEVVGQAGDGEELLRKVKAHRPDVAIVDIRMPPSYLDEGLRAAETIRQEMPQTGVLVLSQYVEEECVMRLMAQGTEGVGYLLKDRIADIERLLDAVARVSQGGSVLDPEVVAHMLGRRPAGPLDTLTPREAQALALMAEGHTNRAIAEQMHVTERAVERHVTSIFDKLDLAAGTTGHRRVLAVLTFLRA